MREDDQTDAGATVTGSLAAKLARGSAAALFIHAGGAGITYGAQLVVARTIGAAGYGVYAYVLAWMTVLAYVAALGFDVSLLRFVPAYLARRAFALLRGVIGYALRRGALVGCGIAGVGAGFVLFRSGTSPPVVTDTFLVGFLLVPLLALLWMCGAVVRGLGGVVSALAPDRMLRDGVLFALVFIVGVGMRWPVDARWAMTASVVGAAAGLGLVGLAGRRLRPVELDAFAPAYEAPAWRRTAAPLVVIGVGEVLMNRTGVMLLGAIGDTKAAGIYALAFNIALVVALPRTAVNALLAPAISDLFARGKRARLRTIVAKAGWWTLGGALCIALPVLVLCGPLLGVFGRGFVAAVPALRILVVAQLCAAAAGSPMPLMTMTGHERVAAACLVGGAAANAAVAAALVGPLGPTGAALAAAAALIGFNAAMGISIRRRLRFLPGVFAVEPSRAGKLAAAGQNAGS